MFSLIGAVSQGAVGGGVVTAIARSLGRGDRDRADRLAWYAMAIATGLGLLTTALALGFGPRFYAAMGARGKSLSAALKYSHLVFRGAIFIWSFNLLLATVRGTGNMMLPVAVVCGGALVLLPLSPLLIFGFGPLPALGVAGAALAILSYYAVGTLISASYFGEGMASFGRRSGHPRWNGSQFARSCGWAPSPPSSVRQPIFR